MTHRSLTSDHQNAREAQMTTLIERLEAAEAGSLDAALTLVPEGWEMQNLMWLHDSWLATLTKKDGFRSVAAEAATPALALTTASLRAKEIEDDTNEAGV